MFFIGLGTTAPETVFRQQECWQSVSASPLLQQLELRSRAILKKVLTSDNGITSRHLALDSLAEVYLMEPDRLQARFARHAPALATAAAQKALADACCRAEEMDALIISTCTGYLCPGLTSYVSEQLGLRRDALGLDLVGQGCGAALPNFRTAEALLASGRAKNVLSICVEVCSAAFYLDNDPGVLISACLFGDGAGAAVLAREPLPGRRRVEWTHTRSQLSPEKREILRFSHRNGMLRNILLPEVPAVTGRAAADLFAAVQAETGVSAEKIAAWIFHAGGRDVLLALRENFSLDENAVAHSAAVLREYGNISSPTVYFVLEASLRDRPDGWWWLSAFGAGFTCHGALLKVSS